MILRRDFLLGTAASAVVLSSMRGAWAADNDELSALLRDRIDTARQSVGIIACTFDANGQTLTTHGRSDATNGRALDGDTVFEIGSITKVFTALLLAEMTLRGEVALDDPVAKYLPDTVKMPSRNGRQITLLDLATYTSGLPRIPDGISNTADNPYAAYGAEQLYAFLSNHTLRFVPGRHYEYANLGFGLLGHALALRGGKSYEEMIVSRICEPLGLQDTRITLTASMRDRLAQGHLSNLSPSSNWDFQVFAGAGALRSTANDLVRFMKAACFTAPGLPLQPSFDLLLKTRRPTDAATIKVALGWFITSGRDDELVWKDGTTGGYTSFAGFSTRLKSGAIILSNAANPLNDLGYHLTNPAFPIAEYPPQLTIDPAILATYAGVYRMTSAFSLAIRAEAGRLFVRGSGQPEFELFAEADNRFFMRMVDAQGTFLRNADGAVDRLLWHQGGKYVSCPRLP
jgi:CubicO group peptidase (beta-lactamase class C family)